MNTDKIYEKVKMKIAISNVKEEDMVMNKRKVSFGKGIGIAACIALSMTGVVFATTQIINKFGTNSSDGIETAIQNEYYEDVNTKYKDSNGISANIESFLLDAHNFDISINLKFDSNYDLSKMLADGGKIDVMDLKVMNENNEKVFATHELESEEMTSLYKTEQEAKENYDSYEGAYGGTTEKLSENELKFYLTATGNPKNFPSSKKLFVSFNKIRQRYWENNEPKYIIYNGEWSFEIDVPTKMAKTNLINYKITSISDNSYKFESAVLSNTSFKIRLNNCSGITYNENECVETSDGLKYYPAHRSDGDGEISVNSDGTVRYYNTFNLTSFNATDKLKVHLFKTNGEEVIIELEKTK